MSCSQSLDYSRIDVCLRHLKGKRHEKKATKQEEAGAAQRSIAGLLAGQPQLSSPVSLEEQAFRVCVLHRCLKANISISQISLIADLLRPPGSNFSMPLDSVIRQTLIPLSLTVEEARIKELISHLKFVPSKPSSPPQLPPPRPRPSPLDSFLFLGNTAFPTMGLPT